MGEGGVLFFLGSAGVAVFNSSFTSAAEVGEAMEGENELAWCGLESFSSCPEPASLSQWDTNVEGSSEGLPSPSPGQLLWPCPFQTHTDIPALARHYLPVSCCRGIIAWPAEIPGGCCTSRYSTD